MTANIVDDSRRLQFQRAFGDAFATRPQHVGNQYNIVNRPDLIQLAQVSAAVANFRVTYESAVRQRDDIMPRFTASQVSVFDLRCDARTQISSVDQTVRMQAHLSGYNDQRLPKGMDE